MQSWACRRVDPCFRTALLSSWRRQATGGLAPEPDAILLPSLTADDQGAAYKVVANSPEFIKLLAVPVGNIMAKVPDYEPVDKDGDSRFVRCSYQDCRQVAVGRMTPRSGRDRRLAQGFLETACADDGCDHGTTAPAVHKTMVVVSHVCQARIFKICFGQPPGQRTASDACFRR